MYVKSVVQFFLKKLAGFWSGRTCPRRQLRQVSIACSNKSHLSNLSSDSPLFKMLYFRRKLIRIIPVLCAVFLLLLMIIRIRDRPETSTPSHHQLGDVEEFTINSKTFETGEGCLKRWFTNCAKKGRKDWHDHRLIELEKDREGPGEGGEAVADVSKITEKEKSSGYSSNGFNAAVSDMIALDRSVKDIRHKKCAEIEYEVSLPSVSVIVPFHNEHWSTLLRTVVSVLNRSPKELIKEVLLVDDFSTKGEGGWVRSSWLFNDEFLQTSLDRNSMITFASTFQM